MINFTDLPMRKKAYAGANGSKISVVYNGNLYMLKFPPHPTKNKEMSYSNSCICEYLGCKIFESAAIPVQDTILGIYTTAKGDRKVVVACKDFAADGKTLQDFASLKNQLIDSERNGYGTELSDILLTFEDQKAVDPHIVSDRFWDMFIVDAFIGNWDRHNGNWGFLYDTKADEMTLAPVFDCGSSLYPQADETLIEKILSDEKEINFRIFEIPTSAIKYNDSRINYFNFISSLEIKDCNRALKRITARIDMRKISTIVDETPFISDLQKKFYKTMLAERKERILDHSLTLLRKRECQKDKER